VIHFRLDSPARPIFLFFAGILGGALNAVAGGGSSSHFPRCFSPVFLNSSECTNTLALWTGVTASGGAYRNRLDVPRRVMVPLIRNRLARRRSRRRAPAEDSRPHLYARAAVADAGRHAALYFWQSSFRGRPASVGNEAGAGALRVASNFRVSGGNLWEAISAAA